MGSISLTVTVNRNSQGKYEMVEFAKRQTREELYKVAKQIFQNANRRLRNLEKNGLYSPAYAAAMKEGYFGARGKDFNQLTHEYARAIAFLNMQTSNVSGARTYERHIQSLIGNVSPQQKKAIFEIFRRVEERNMIGAQMYGSSKLIQEISQQMQGDAQNALDELDRDSAEYQAKLDKIVEDMGKLASQKYEETMEVLQETSKLSFDVSF